MELRIKIKDIPEAGAPLARHMAVPQALVAVALEGTDGDAQASQLECNVELSRDHDDVFGRGRVRGVLVLPCGRCLEPARVRVDTPIHLQFSHHAPDEGDTVVEGEEDVERPDVFIHDGKHISLEEPLRELLIAELPISVRCSEDCQGLCAVCGANRNTPEGRACGHSQQIEIVDPTKRRSLGALADLKLPS